MSSVAEIASDTVNDLAKVAQAFDVLAELVRQSACLGSPVDGMPANTEVAQLEAAAVLGLSGLVSEPAKVRDDLARLKQRAVELSANSGHLLFDTARLVARHVLETVSVGGVLERFSAISEEGRSALSQALGAFSENERLKASAMEILAVAILMPQPRFEETCYASNHRPASIAAKLGLPAGAAALRQRILFPDKYAASQI